MSREPSSRTIRIKRGLDIPIAGPPVQNVSDAAEVASVALVEEDYVGLQPEVLVAEGDRVVLGQPVLRDASNPGVQYTAPGSGTVSALLRGARRSLQALVIDLHGEEQRTFESWPASRIATLGAAQVRENLVASGLWTALRTRPFGRVPAIDSEPAALFVTATDTNPLAARPETIIALAPDDFADGVRLLSKLSEGPVYVCTPPDSSIAVPQEERIRRVSFAGPHPAGLVGTHIHFLHPIGPGKTVWYLDYQDAMAIGRLFKTGLLAIERIVSLAGASVLRPRLLRTRVGASIDDLLRNELEESPSRAVAGSVLSGRKASGAAAFLGRYHLQVSVIPERSDRALLGWLTPGRRKFSASRLFASSMLGEKLFDLTTSQQGSPRAMVPIGAFEKVMPLDLLVTPLLKALVVLDVEAARRLGCLELEEEDLALCSFVCCSKYDYGKALRDCLDLLEPTG